MTGSEGPDVDTHRLAEAVGWRVRLKEAGLETSAAFESWRSADSANAEAWQRVQAPWAEIGSLAASPEFITARGDALTRARRVAQLRWRRPIAHRPAAMGGALAVALAVATAAIWLQTRPDVYATDFGERRVVTLSDGSRVALDSGSRLSVRLGRHARRLDLLRGQARFDVAHDTTRPFSVHAGDRTVVATGTSFNVDLLGPRVIVTLLEGHVSVFTDRHGLALGAAPSDPPGPIIRLDPGYRLVARMGLAAASGQIEPASKERTTAWENGRLVFEDEPLGAVAARISRYAAKPVVVTDRQAADLRISGVFTAGDVTTFVGTVTDYLPVVAMPREDGGIDLRSRS